MGKNIVAKERVKNQTQKARTTKKIEKKKTKNRK